MRAAYEKWARSNMFVKRQGKHYEYPQYVLDDEDFR